MHRETQCVHSGGLHDAATGGINSPIYTSTAAERARLGISNALLRLSVGVEHHDDLIEDLAQVPGNG